MQNYEQIALEAKEIVEGIKKTRETEGKTGRMGLCAGCGELRKIKSKGKCYACYMQAYRREKRERMVSHCEICGREVHGDNSDGVCWQCGVPSYKEWEPATCWNKRCKKKFVTTKNPKYAFCPDCERIRSEYAGHFSQRGGRHSWSR